MVGVTAPITILTHGTRVLAVSIIYIQYLLKRYNNSRWTQLAVGALTEKARSRCLFRRVLPSCTLLPLCDAGGQCFSPSLLSFTGGRHVRPAEGSHRKSGCPATKLDIKDSRVSSSLPTSLVFEDVARARAMLLAARQMGDDGKIKSDGWPMATHRTQRTG